MATARIHYPFESVSGTLMRDDLHTHYTRTTKGGKTILCTLADRDRTPTAAQTASMNKFKQTHRQVNLIMADSAQLAPYEAQFRAQNKYRTLRGFIFAKVYNT